MLADSSKRVGQRCLSKTLSHLARRNNDLRSQTSSRPRSRVARRAPTGHRAQRGRHGRRAPPQEFARRNGGARRQTLRVDARRPTLLVARTGRQVRGPLAGAEIAEGLPGLAVLFEIGQYRHERGHKPLQGDPVAIEKSQAVAQPPAAQVNRVSSGSAAALNAEGSLPGKGVEWLANQSCKLD